jgi:hypothetical protein
MAKVEAAWREPSRSRKLARGSRSQAPSSQIAPIATLPWLELIKETLDTGETTIRQGPENIIARTSLFCASQLSP